MANNYGLVSIDGSPSQEDIDGFLNWCDANPPEISSLASLDDEDIEKVVDKISGLKEDAEKQLESIVGNALKPLESSSQVYSALVKPPTTPDECVTYCKSLVQYFVGPYQYIVVLIIWWTSAATVYSAAVSQMVDRISNVVTELQKLAANKLSEQMQKVKGKLADLENGLNDTLAEIQSDINDKLSSFYNLSNDISSQLSGMKNELTKDISSLQLSANDLKDMIEDKTELSTVQTLSAFTNDKLSLNSVKDINTIKAIGKNDLFGKVDIAKLLPSVPSIA